MEQQAPMPPNSPHSQNKMATCKLHDGKGPWSAVAPKPSRRTVWENRRLKPHSCPFRGFKSKMMLQHLAAFSGAVYFTRTEHAS